MLALLRNRARRGRRRGAARPSPPQHHPQPLSHQEREKARALAAAIERAMTLGQWAHADRVAAAASRMAHDHPVLTEWLARLRLAQGQPEAALNLVDCCRGQWSSLRLLRAVCLLQLGRRVEAHLDLQQWANKSSAPLQARALLALLEWQAGDTDASVQALLRNLRQLEDPRTLAILMLISAAQDRPQQTSWWADRLRQTWAWNPSLPDLDLLLHSLGLEGVGAVDAQAPASAGAAALAAELLSNETVIPALVHAQELAQAQRSGDAAGQAARSNETVSGLLAQAIEQALPELDNPAIGYESLARLALAANDQEAARQWAERGLEFFPLSAGLARLVQDLQSAPTAEPVSDHPHDVLATIGDGGQPPSALAAQEQAA